jgi:hypothetical protein
MCIRITEVDGFDLLTAGRLNLHTWRTDGLLSPRLQYAVGGGSIPTAPTKLIHSQSLA